VEAGLNNLIAARRAPMADRSVFSTVERHQPGWMPDLGTRHAPEMAVEVTARSQNDVCDMPVQRITVRPLCAERSFDRIRRKNSEWRMTTAPR
jgi:hypothetical protein